jgi:hypothetical protein
MLSTPSGQQILILNPGSTQQGGSVSLDQLSQILAAVQPKQIPKVRPQHLNVRVSNGVEQAQLGVRTDEFHDLSKFAEFVHPAAAIELQMLWDRGNRRVHEVTSLKASVVYCMALRG